MDPDRVLRTNASCGWKGRGSRWDQHARQDDKRHGQDTQVAKGDLGMV